METDGWVIAGPFAVGCFTRVVAAHGLRGREREKKTKKNNGPNRGDYLKPGGESHTDVQRRHKDDLGLQQSGREPHVDHRR
jgi:hypothetical protein